MMLTTHRVAPSHMLIEILVPLDYDLPREARRSVGLDLKQILSVVASRFVFFFLNGNFADVGSTGRLSAVTRRTP